MVGYLLPHLQPKSLAKRPIDEEIPADDVCAWKISPIPGIGAVHGIVAHDHVVVWADHIFVVLVGEEPRQARLPILFGHEFIHMAGVFILLRTSA